MQMRVGGRFSPTVLVILASELFSRVMSAVQSPKHCLHTIKATKRDFPRPVNAVMNQAASVRHRICGCSFCRLIRVARHSRQPNAIIAQGIDSTLGPYTGQSVLTDSPAGGVELQLAYNRGAPLLEMIRKSHSRLLVRIHLCFLEKKKRSTTEILL